HEVADACVDADAGARADVREWAYRCTCTDGRIGNDAVVQDGDVVANGAVGDARPRSDVAPCAYRGAPGQNHAWGDDGVFADRDVRLDEGCRRVFERDALKHQCTPEVIEQHLT